MVVLGGRAVSLERGTPVSDGGKHAGRSSIGPDRRSAGNSGGSQNPVGCNRMHTQHFQKIHERQVGEFKWAPSEEVALVEEAVVAGAGH